VCVPPNFVGAVPYRPVDNRLAYIDQASFLGLRALGHEPLCQCTWIYDRGIDIDGLRRFHRNLGHGLLGRRIERSPLPFARDRWVLSTGRDIDFETMPRCRADVSAWADERAQLPVDPEWGPSWHLGVLPLLGGGAAVSLVASHTVADGLGILQAVTDAAEGRARDLGYPAPGSRTRGRAVLQDARQTAGAMPETARALAATVRLVRRNRRDLASSVASAPRPRSRCRNDRVVAVPSVTAYLDVAEWDARARSLGGTSNSLFAGFASRLGANVGRLRDDGTATLSFPVSERTEDDLRANALTSVVVAVDPKQAATDLRDIRVEIKQALAGRRDRPNELLGPLPLTPMVPKRVARRLAGMALGTADLPIGCSNVGDVDPAVNRPDGSDADYFSLRLTEPGLTAGALDRMGGLLFLASGRVHGQVFIAVAAYLVAAANSRDGLRELISGTLAEFDLTGALD
jgi:hypothetical protein